MSIFIKKSKLFLREKFKIYYDYLVIKNSQPLLILQMAKTGSESLFFSLKNVGYKGVYRLHTLTQNYDYYNYPYLAKKNKLLLQRIQEIKTPVKIITSVREPVQRNISDFFQLIKLNDEFQTLRMPPLLKSYNELAEQLKPNLTLSELQNLFFQYYPDHFLCLNWFQEEIEKNFNIDVYDFPFPKEKGFLVIKKDNIELLILKLELNNNEKEKAIKEFLNLPYFQIIPSNITEKQQFSYSNLYQDFKQNISFPTEYLDKLYKSQYTNHFYID
ncbi:MAG: hypothetical protein IGQ45_08955 [Cyanobacterium sp. T60_A2020_053]|nr:hypothetical protein [Cyanobacterium sp. T60_A2020_053]